MKKLCMLLLLVVTATLITTTKTAASPAAAPGPRTVGEGTFTVSSLAGDYDLVNHLWEFPAGSWTPLHTHPGRTLLVVLAGEFTLREDGKESRYPAGTFWTEAPAMVHAAGNQGQATPWFQQPSCCRRMHRFPRLCRVPPLRRSPASPSSRASSMCQGSRVITTLLSAYSTLRRASGPRCTRTPVLCF